MLRRMLLSFTLIVSFLTSQPVHAQTVGETAACDATPECWAWIAYQKALADWYQAVLLAAWYDGLTRGDCGGELPPCYVMMRESGGRIDAENLESTAAGKWQMLIGTSNNVARAMGRPDLVDVPASYWTESEQDEGARILWNGGAGCSHWAAC